MSVRYTEYTLPGVHTTPIAMSALGHEVGNGLVVRVTTTPTETRIVLAHPAQSAAAPSRPNAIYKSRTISEADVSRID